MYSRGFSGYPWSWYFWRLVDLQPRYSLDAVSQSVMREYIKGSGTYFVASLADPLFLETGEQATVTATVAITAAHCEG